MKITAKKILNDFSKTELSLLKPFFLRIGNLLFWKSMPCSIDRFAQMLVDEKENEFNRKRKLEIIKNNKSHDKNYLNVDKKVFDLPYIIYFAKVNNIHLMNDYILELELRQMFLKEGYSSIRNMLDMRNILLNRVVPQLLDVYPFNNTNEFINQISDINYFKYNNTRNEYELNSAIIRVILSSLRFTELSNLNWKDWSFMEIIKKEMDHESETD